MVALGQLISTPLPANNPDDLPLAFVSLPYLLNEPLFSTLFTAGPA
jgi:hypothetical protein